MNPASSSPYGAKALVNGDTAALLTKFNENATRIDLAMRYGGGAYGIVTGLDLSAGSGLTLNIAAGSAVIDTVVVKDSSPYSLPDLSGSRGYVWLSSGGVYSHTTTTTPPAGAQLFIGSFVTNAGAIVSLDQSGIMYLYGGIPERRTADTGKPADTPPSNLRHLVRTSAQLWFWDAANYYLLSSGETHAPTAVTLFTGSQTWTNIPAAQTELFGSSIVYRTKVDLAQFTEARVTAAIQAAANAGAQLQIQYSADESTWLALDGGSGSLVNIGATGTRAGNWVTISAAARAAGVVALRVIGENGDGAADPVIGNVTLWLR